VPRVSLHITGRVQGVNYRTSTRRRASELALTGFVRNLADGSVEAVVEGPRPDLEALIRWCHGGPPNARVEAVQTRWSEETGEFDAFTVRR
jgi:acylphosphatase